MSLMQGAKCRMISHTIRDDPINLQLQQVFYNCIPIYLIPSHPINFAWQKFGKQTTHRPWLYLQPQFMPLVNHISRRKWNPSVDIGVDTRRVVLRCRREDVDINRVGSLSNSLAKGMSRERVEMKSRQPWRIGSSGRTTSGRKVL